jgi:peptidoglycan hydrolase CwlO-like protein
VRSANRKKSWLGNRRLFGGPNGGGAALASGEADSAAPLVVNEPGGAAAPPAHLNGDPTQRLLTALGRFQRQVARAESGAPQAQWVDECMNQLITGIELAVAQEWDNVMQALTDTARVLASYESAERAGECVPFLEDAYEILCLMVGDLIVDNVRSGVMVKWRERYNEAVGDLSRAGIELMEDEEDAPAPSVARPAEASMAPELDDEEAGTDVLDEELDYGEQMESGIPADEDDDQPLETGHSVEPESGTEPEMPFADPLAASELAVHPGEQEGEDELELPSLEDALGASAEEQAWEEEGDTAEPETLEHEDELAEEDEGASGALDDGLGWLDEESGEPEPAGAEPPYEHTGVLTEQQDLFSGIETGGEDVAETTESDLVIEQLPPEPAGLDQDEAPPAAPAAAPDTHHSAEHLLTTAQEALSLGNVADAKLLALELALKMARMEAERSEARVRECETHLDGNRRAIEEADAGIVRCDQEVADADARVAEREQEYRAHRDRMDTLSGEMETVSTRIADLEAKIRELEAKRADELRLQEEIRGRYEEAQGIESRIQTEIEALNESARQVQEGLEATREHVAALQQERVARERELEEAKRRHGQRRRSVEEIDRTIASVRALLDGVGSDEDGPDGAAPESAAR